MDTPPLADEQLLTELREALAGYDDVPASVSDAAKAAYGWRTIDAEIAALSYDSLLDDKQLAGVRSVSETFRMLTFEHPGVTVELSIEADRILGQLVPPQTGEVELRHPEGSTVVPADEIGRFTFDDVPHGPVSLRCTTSGVTPVVTDWIIV